ncbi:helix-turn-helix domain-containing protein [Rhodococcus globerulus]|uniref:Helix-turn-helix transcriptional regulator n=1 Tax=Rhodococcus globerulus TaxID=33008 RepID=A0ABU4C2H0_RHOGO|nr:helix-turn-helix transcriptional regulator [Rhodococcus globerulus]MDV6270677.1 helix-turn-helix transcriptional regulator [Rhodococcus globerulus]
MTTPSTGARIEKARLAARISSQRQLADKAGISQPTLSRIIADTRPAKANELLAIAMATGCTLAELTGTSTLADRVQYAARSTNGANMDQMREQLLHFLELDAYLEDQGIGIRA